MEKSKKKKPMWRKLFIYMFSIALIISGLLSCGLFFLGQFSTSKQKANTNLSFQMNTFERQVSKYFEDMTRIGNSLSLNFSNSIDSFLIEENISFENLNDNSSLINKLQTNLFDNLKTELLKTHCSGSFLILNATVNTSIDDFEKSRSGLYFQRASLDESDETLLLYRGISEIGRGKGIMPHRKWRLEFDTDVFNGYDIYLNNENKKNPFLSNISTLFGTSERTMNFIIPIINDENLNYGLCGFEISENYFKKYFAQPSQLEHLTCMLFLNRTNILNSVNCFSSGVYNGYYLPPTGELNIKDIGDNLYFLEGDSSYISKLLTIKICDSNYLLVTAYPKGEYEKEKIKNIISIIVLVSLLVFAIVMICIFLTRRFLHPLLLSINQIKQKQHKISKAEYVEIEDLFAFLEEQDKINDEEKQKLFEQCSKQDKQLEQNKTDIDRLAYLRKKEVDPDDYEMFKIGLKTLTKTERQIFNLYLDGKTACEIMEICNIQKGTLKFHNHNILNKLNVPSRKQMLRYATLLKQECDKN